MLEAQDTCTKANNLEEDVDRINGRLRAIEINFTSRLSVVETKLTSIGSNLKLISSLLIGLFIAIIGGITAIIIKG